MLNTLGDVSGIWAKQLLH